MSFTFVMIGAGNLAFHLTKRLVDCGFQLKQVFSRTDESAKALAETCDAPWTSFHNCIFTDADIYFICLTDSAVQPFLESANLKNKFLIHCSGGISIDVLCAYTPDAGVLYPLQTFSKSRFVDFREVPLFLEFSSAPIRDVLLEIAGRLSNSVFFATGRQRSLLHLAAVFSCNFVNHLYSIADLLLEENNMDFEYLHPLVKETLNKAIMMKPFDAQTGPAVRNDQIVMDKHLDLLKGRPDLQSLYIKISDHINNSHQN